MYEMHPRLESSMTLRTLLLETSGRAGIVAVAVGERVVAERHLAESRRQARDLAPFVADLLREQGWTPRNLGAIIVSLGPGSYTGLRVGAISAKVLAHVTGCALLGIPTFAAVALQAPLAPRVEVLADAQKDKVYVQAFARTEAGVTPLEELRIVTWDAWAATCPAGALVTGPGAVKYPDRLPAGVTLLDAAVREPHPASLLRLALARLERGERDDPFALEPIYLRPSSAEEQWDARATKLT